MTEPDPPATTATPVAAPAAPVSPALPADVAETRADEADARLLRNVRWRLVAFAGGSTLLVLVTLGVALYLSVASSLQSTAVAALDQRASDVLSFGRPPGADNGPIDYVFGGGGTFAILIAPDSTAIGPRQFPVPNGLPDSEAAVAANGSGRDVRLSTITVRSPRGRVEAVPVRQLTVPLDTSQGRFYVQVVQDRSAEVRTLESLLLVLVGGGLVVVLVAVAFGAVYARRALVPIRESLATQRTALRRQREFAADASHELRTPLTVIRASVEHLRRHGDQPVAEVGDALVDIDDEVQHLTSLVDDLLLLARSDSGAVTLERVPIHLDDVAADAAAALAQPAAAAGVRLEVDPEPTTAVGDPARLRQLVMILLDNAIRHSPRGGTVRVVVRPSGEAASVAVEDAGSGVRPEDRARVFDRFWRAPGAPPGGTGLGLAIAKWIAEHHDGGISVDRSAAGGARFEVRLPNRPAPEAPA
jgi:two-component system sensor histidine kinase CiaH